MTSMLASVQTAPIPLLDPTRLWECPSGCGARKRTTKPGVITPMHRCRMHGGVDIPMQAADRYGISGERHHIELIERGDYLRGERPDHGGIMAVHANRSDGSHDTVVFAAPAGSRLDGRST